MSIAYYYYYILLLYELEINNIYIIVFIFSNELYGI